MWIDPREQPQGGGDHTALPLRPVTAASCAYNVCEVKNKGGGSVRHVETLSGNGTAASADGTTVGVRYELDISEREIPDGFGGTIPGSRTIRGSIRPYCGAPGETLTLRMEDGRTLEFFFTTDDSITGCGAIKDR